MLPAFEAYARALATVRHHVGVLAAATLVLGGVMFGLSLLIGLGSTALVIVVGPNGLLLQAAQLVGQLVNVVLITFLSLGYARILIECGREREPSLGVLFTEGRRLVVGLITNSLGQTLASLLVLLPGAACGGLIVYLFVASELDLWLKAVAGVCAGALLLVLTMPLMIWSYLSLAFLVDREQAPLGALASGWRSMELWGALRYGGTSVLMFAVGACAALVLGCGLGVLVVVPWLLLGLVHVYLDACQRLEARLVEEPAPAAEEAQGSKGGALEPAPEGGPAGRLIRAPSSGGGAPPGSGGGPPPGYGGGPPPGYEPPPGFGGEPLPGYEPPPGYGGGAPPGDEPPPGSGGGPRRDPEGARPEAALGGPVEPLGEGAKPAEGVPPGPASAAEVLEVSGSETPGWVHPLTLAVLSPLVAAGGSPLSGGFLGYGLARSLGFPEWLGALAGGGALLLCGVAALTIQTLALRGRSGGAVDRDGVVTERTARWGGWRLRWSEIAAFEITGEGVVVYPRAPLGRLRGRLIPARDSDAHHLVERLEAEGVYRA